MPGTEARWTWASIRPGITYWPLPETTLASAGGLAAALGRSMRRMRPFSMTTEPTAGWSRFSGERMVTLVIQTWVVGDEFAGALADESRANSVVKSEPRPNRTQW